MPEEKKKVQADIVISGHLASGVHGDTVTCACA
jgi:hypothetical protein